MIGHERACIKSNSCGIICISGIVCISGPENSSLICSFIHALLRGIIWFSFITFHSFIAVIDSYD